jgi:hypothetical protein
MFSRHRCGLAQAVLRITRKKRAVNMSSLSSAFRSNKADWLPL